MVQFYEGILPSFLSIASHNTYPKNLCSQKIAQINEKDYSKRNRGTTDSAYGNCPAKNWTIPKVALH